jgi:periplasmic protein CpxP/Spy
MLWFRIPLLFSILVSFVTTISPARADLLMTQTNRSAHSEVKISQGGVGNLIKELNLSRDQIQRIQKIRADAQGKIKARRQALRAARQELNQLLQGNASADLVRQKRQQVQSLQREVADNNFENTLAIREILNPEQRVKLQQLIQQRRQNGVNAN